MQRKIFPDRTFHLWFTHSKVFNKPSAWKSHCVTLEKKTAGVHETLELFHHWWDFPPYHSSINVVGLLMTQIDLFLPIFK